MNNVYYFIYIILRILVYPFVRFLLPLISSSAKARVLFEHKNHFETPMIKRAQYAFEISSEGELEQIKYILEQLLENGECVELIFCSESVEHRCLELRKKYPQQLRTLRLPLITYSVWNRHNHILRWITAKTLILCRYDFFPELIYYGSRPKIDFILLSGAITGWERKSFLAKWYLRICYRYFDKIVVVNNQHKKLLIEQLSLDSSKINIFDFRIINIINRLSISTGTLNAKFPLHSKFSEFLKTYETKTVLGSFWEHELSLFPNELEQYNFHENIYCLAPHKLGATHIQAIVSGLNKKKIESYLISESTTSAELDSMIHQYKKNGGIWILQIKGILCEMYKNFDLAYVGGGFGDSVHSVLEPYLAGCSVMCGPKTERSSEFDMIKDFDPSAIVSFNNENQFFSIMSDLKSHKDIKSVQFATEQSAELKTVLNWLDLPIRDSNA